MSTLEFGLESLASKVEHSTEVIWDELRRDLGRHSHWTGKLSDSALSTATAISALGVCLKRAEEKAASGGSSAPEDERYGPAVWRACIEKGSQWLSRAQNADGGFGDTDRSLSNIATTLLVIAAWEIVGHQERYAGHLRRAWAYVDKQGRWDGLRKRYGKDKTFVVPIMTNCAIAGLVDWREIPTLPFEAAALPQSWYRFAKMPVVSYAIPALVAIGQAQFVHAPPRNPIAWVARSFARQRTLRVLSNMQPGSGGYLEATPLTSFVLMSLASIGLEKIDVAKNAIRFLVDSVMPDGSWPIDTNLATWVTSLTMRHFFSPRFADRWNTNVPVDWSLNAREANDPASAEGRWVEGRMQDAWVRSVDWLLSCQHLVRHPFTGAEPGGWGWTNLSGAVPDADDTPAALIALADFHRWGNRERESALSSKLEDVRHASELGVVWLLKLQNGDGGWPTFCKGWGTLPFDRSGSDLTAHALRALSRWRSRMPDSLRPQIDRGMDRGWRYLEKTQQPDGSWLPLWFGNQDRPDEDNPIYGTARVILAFGECDRSDDRMALAAMSYLKKSQNNDGGWGGGPSIRYPGDSGKELAHSSSTLEETAVALEGIMSCGGKKVAADSIMRGLTWLCDSIERGHHYTSQPIGFYFAKLWYHERHYPLAFSLGALKKGLEFCQR